jgi:CRP-like cAMP-binding protein
VAVTGNSNHEFGLRACTYCELLSLESGTYEELAEESVRFGELVSNEAIRQENLVRRAITNLTRFTKLTKVSVYDQKRSGHVR